MVLYGITLAPLVEDLRVLDSELLSLFYIDDAAFVRSLRHSAQLLKLLMEREPNQGYFPEPPKSIFIPDTRGQKGVTRWEFAAEGLEKKFVSGSWYLVMFGPAHPICHGLFFRPL